MALEAMHGLLSSQTLVRDEKYARALTHVCSGSIRDPIAAAPVAISASGKCR